jgi:hypothetical protein
MLTPSKQTTNRKTKRSAQAHLIYTSNDVLRLLDIAPNTLTAWKKLGLSCVRSTSDLYLGQDISRFLKWNKQQRRVPLEKTEAGSNQLAVTCPNTGKHAHRFISPSELRFIEREFNRKSRTDQEDYNVDQVGSKIAIPSPLHSMINNPAI